MYINHSSTISDLWSWNKAFPTFFNCENGASKVHKIITISGQNRSLLMLTQSQFENASINFFVNYGTVLQARSLGLQQRKY